MAPTDLVRVSHYESAPTRSQRRHTFASACYSHPCACASDSNASSKRAPLSGISTMAFVVSFPAISSRHGGGRLQCRKQGTDAEA